MIQQTKDKLDNRTRHIYYLVTLLGCQGIDEYRTLRPAALNMGVTLVEVKEIVYQATAYSGMGRVCPFLTATNEIFEQRVIALSRPPQAQATQASRREADRQAKVDCFGEQMRDFWQSGPDHQQEAGRQRLRRLRHPNGVGYEVPRTHRFLLPRCLGRLRAAAEGAHRRQLPRRQ